MSDNPSTWTQHGESECVGTYWTRGDDCPVYVETYGIAFDGKSHPFDPPEILFRRRMDMFRVRLVDGGGPAMLPGEHWRNWQECTVFFELDQAIRYADVVVSQMGQGRE